ncbi:MAG: MMPL family transporter [Treponema sp.]|nr:MMPL family transporter [Treponema sp.]
MAVQNRFLLLDKETVQKINQGGGVDELKELALQKAFGAFSLTPLEFVDGDPFFLADLELQNLIERLSNTGTSLALRDGVLAAEYDGEHYVMVRGALTQKGASVTSKKNGVQTIYDCARRVAASSDFGNEGGQDVSFVFSGSPFHSHKSATSAQRQVAVISALSMLAVVVLLLLVFRSARPLLFSVGAVTLSAAFGLGTELLVFGQIHILTFVFGTTLIGTCLDYSLHFWTRAYFSQEALLGAQAMKKIFKGLALSFASTEVCYLIMLLAPFALLKQISVFCFAGILSAFAPTVLFYPALSVPQKKLSSAMLNGARFAFPRHLKKILLFAAAGTCLALAIFFRQNLRLDNDLRKFYTMSGKLLEDEKLSASVMNRKSGARYFIVRANSADALLQSEEAFCTLLQEEVEAGRLDSFSATSQFVPSKKSKRASLAASQKLMEAAPDLQEIFGSEARDFAPDFLEARALLDAPDDSGMEGVPPYLKDALETLWLGKIGQEYFSAVFVSGGDAENLKSLAARFGAGELGANGAADAQAVCFVDKVGDIAFELNRLTKIMLVLLAAAFVVLILALAFFYKPKALAKVAAVPLLVLLCEVAVIAAFKIPLGFFAVTGIILVFGLGLDYIIYTVESGGDAVNSLAVLLSFATTALSFGAIALSSFMPVHIFGTVVFFGLVAAWVSARVLK